MHKADKAEYLGPHDVYGMTDHRYIDRWKRRILKMNAGMESYGFVKYSDSPRGGCCLK